MCLLWMAPFPSRDPGLGISGGKGVDQPGKLIQLYFLSMDAVWPANLLLWPLYIPCLLLWLPHHDGLCPLYICEPPHTSFFLWLLLTYDFITAVESKQDKHSLTRPIYFLLYLFVYYFLFVCVFVYTCMYTTRVCPFFLLWVLGLNPSPQTWQSAPLSIESPC